MAKKRPGWNLRPFSETLKRECRSRAAKQGKAEWQWLTELLCREFEISVDSLSVLDSGLGSADETDKGQFDEVLRRMLETPPQKTADIKATKKPSKPSPK